MNRLRISDLRRPHDNIHVGLREWVVVYLFRGIRGYRNLWVSSRSLQHSGFWCNALNRYGFRDHGPFDLCLCQHKAYDVSTEGYDYYSG
jgi:hypothetical protein